MVVGEGDTHMFLLAPYITQMNSPKEVYNTLAKWDYIYIYINLINFFVRKRKNPYGC